MNLVIGLYLIFSSMALIVITMHGMDNTFMQNAIMFIGIEIVMAMIFIGSYMLCL